MLLSYGFWNQTEKSLFSTYLAYNPDGFNSRTLQHNQIQSIMDVITIESKAYHELMGKIEKILRYVEKEEKAKTELNRRCDCYSETSVLCSPAASYDCTPPRAGVFSSS